MCASFFQYLSGYNRGVYYMEVQNIHGYLRYFIIQIQTTNYNKANTKFHWLNMCVDCISTENMTCSSEI